MQMMIIATPLMHQDRAAHTATRLSNGTVLFVGGFSNREQALNSAEIFDPETNTFFPTVPNGCNSSITYCHFTSRWQSADSRRVQWRLS